jgi:predicted SAM-dependent methyltransferase
MSKAISVNLGCGPVFVDSPEWLNLDFTPCAPAVKKANLLGRLPLKDASVHLVYSSHFLEHVPRSSVPSLLAECYRVLAPGGVIRLVLPDLENIAREYLSMRDSGDHQKADFVVLELIDQCVRMTPGGELGKFYHSLRGNDAYADKMIDYVRQRVGEDLRITPARNSWGGAFLHKLHKVPSALRTRAERYYIRALISLLPAAFRQQNVSLAGVGERHHWVWDFHQLRHALREAGLIGVQRQTAQTSNIQDFPLYPLDLDRDGLPRKGAESMVVEAQKPG